MCDSTKWNFPLFFETLFFCFSIFCHVLLIFHRCRFINLTFCFEFLSIYYLFNDALCPFFLSRLFRNRWQKGHDEHAVEMHLRLPTSAKMNWQTICDVRKRIFQLDCDLFSECVWRVVGKFENTKKIRMGRKWDREKLFIVIFTLSSQFYQVSPRFFFFDVRRGEIFFRKFSLFLENNFKRWSSLVAIFLWLRNDHFLSDLFSRIYVFRFSRNQCKIYLK